MCHLPVIDLPSKPRSDSWILEEESESNQTMVTVRRAQTVSWKATTATPEDHISLYYNALEVLRHFSLCSLEIMSTKGICFLIMFLWAAWVACKQFNIHCCIPLMLYFLEDCLGDTRKKITVIKVRLQYTIAFLWILYPSSTNRLEKIDSTRSLEKQSCASKTMTLGIMLLSISVLHLHSL